MPKLRPIYYLKHSSMLERSQTPYLSEAALGIPFLLRLREVRYTSRVRPAVYYGMLYWRVLVEVQPRRDSNRCSVSS